MLVTFGESEGDAASFQGSGGVAEVTDNGSDEVIAFTAVTSVFMVPKDGYRVVRL
jgi:hypothetical protein